jgi:hypothetical protein
MVVLTYSGSIEFEECTSVLGCTKEELRDSIKFWAENRILTMDGSMIISSDSKTGPLPEEDISADAVEMEIEDDTASSSAIDQIWPMLQGMLKNLGSMEPPAIHQTLGMFASDIFSYNLSLLELKALLESLVSLDRLEQDGSKYKLKKN